MADVSADTQKPIARRHVLQVGGLGLLGVTLPRLLESQAHSEAAGIRPKADACIILFLNGGPSHLDMWDLKPDAPDGIRGEFQPIATSLPGYTMSEHLPRLARHAHRATVVRSMHHSVNNAHAAAVYTSLTGHDRGDATVAIGTQPTDYPSPGSLVSFFRPPTRPVLPHVALPYMTREGADGPPQPGFFGGFLGHAYDPLFVLRDPNAADFGVPELTLHADVTAERLAVRRALYERLEQTVAARFGGSSSDTMTAFQSRAIRLLTSPETRRAFQLGQEPDSVRSAYGRNIYGQSVLLARRLIEAGTRVVTLSWAPNANATWDTHGSNFVALKTRLLPQLDAACSRLIDDLDERGLLERTIVAVFGDFGRSPRINANSGRDHWNYCYSLMLVGGGFRKGSIYGASDRIGAFPANNPLAPGDVVATLYHLLGIRHDGHVYDVFRRPYRIVPSGDVIDDLIA
jgi:Protein of unknown function (DUF1501)